MGAQRARQLTDETLSQLGIREMKTAYDRLRFGNALIARGGVLESIGRAIKIQAILHGAPTNSRPRKRPIR